MRAALYTRVSTDMQVEDGFSLSGQLNLLTEYCSKNKIDVHELYSDEGISGQKENRPGFQKMIKDAEKKLFDIILVYKFDRFARKVELSQRIKNQLKKSSVNVISITEPIENSPIGFFSEGILELLAEYFSKDLAIKTKMGHKERASQGFHNGSVPYGYRRVLGSNDIEIVVEQAKIVRQIFDMYVNQGFGCTKISRLLNYAEIPSAVKGEWGHYTINRILKNKKYIGMIYYDGELYPAKHQPIITEDIFEKAQSFFKDRTWVRECRGYNFDKYLLLGFLYCGECGKTFRIWVDKRKQSAAYYQCNNSKHMDKSTWCRHSKSYSFHKLEQKIIDNIKMDLKSGISLAECSIDFNIDLYAQRRLDISKELQRAKNAYLKEVFTLDEYDEVKNKLESEAKEIPEPQERKKDMKKILTLWDEFNSIDSIPERKSILKLIVKRIHVYKDKIEITYQ